MNVHPGTQPSYLHLALGWTIHSYPGPSVFLSRLLFPPQGIIQNVLFVPIFFCSTMIYRIIYIAYRMLILCTDEEYSPIGHGSLFAQIPTDGFWNVSRFWL